MTHSCLINVLSGKPNYKQLFENKSTKYGIIIDIKQNALRDVSPSEGTKTNRSLSMSDSNVIPLAKQTWCPIPGFEDTYEVSEYGIVRRSRDGKNRPAGSIIAHNRDKYGYERVQLWDANTKVVRTFAVHRLVMLVFMGEIPEGKEVNHKDGNKANNHLANLEYVTHRENIIHSFRELDRMETVARGEKAGKAKLTEPQVIEIRRRAAAGETRRAIAREYNVSNVAINHVVNRKTWRHVEEVAS